MKAPLLILSGLCLWMLGAAPASPEPGPASMGVVEAAVLGVVEGLSEYLPISSTGHLILTQRLLGIPTESADQKNAADAFAICIQAGAILAVLGLYWHRTMQMGRGLLGQDPVGRQLAWNLMIAFCPAAVIGLSAVGWIKQHLFGLWPIVVAWGVGGLALVLVEAKRRKGTSDGQAIEPGVPLESMHWQMALVIGVCQCVAMWPGVSRSLVTILVGWMVGLRLTAAVEFSFLLGVITLGAATAYDTYQHGPLLLEHYGLAPLIVGTVTAMVSAALAVQWMVGHLQKRSLSLFGYYRMALALVVAALLLGGVLRS